MNLGLTRMTSCAYSAPNSDRQFISVGAGSYRKLLVVPLRNVCRLVNVACPYWLSAMVSFDWNCWNQAPKLNWCAPCVSYPVFIGVQIASDGQVASVVASGQANLRLRVRCRAAAHHHRTDRMSDQKARER